MDKKYLAEIKAREQAATPGEWYITTNDSGGFSIFTTISGKTYKVGETFVDDDARLAAHARTDIPVLVAEVERLTEENSVGRETNESCRKYIQTLKRQLRAAPENKPLTLDEVKQLKPGTPVSIVENGEIRSHGANDFNIGPDFWGYGDVADGTVKVYARKPEGSKKSC